MIATVLTLLCLAFLMLLPALTVAYAVAQGWLTVDEARRVLLAYGASGPIYPLPCEEKKS